MLANRDPQELVDSAVESVLTDSHWRAVLDEIPAPIYVADQDGAVTYWNRACVAFAGREPQLGRDKWCVTWKIYTTDGDFMPHDQCPMAQAINTRKAVRDAVAIALRPDGSRVAFRPYPTPLFDKDGQFTGAINMLLDVTDEQLVSLRNQAERCRRLAGSMYDRATREMLAAMASSFDKTADELGPVASG
jgi:PAS domain S-box-containing protein